ncbi:bifunctional methylenetetrahydrofolate dehydrogenase/methenyltetrahydrofolate cyclohydrolase [Clostridium chauvoei]|uniref:Bifunctional protein FolD n=2 Tax=Clostridium chauvoei TaxID=46867 RepID=S6ERN5_9CLOT|nr:bifunctional methylenetetrahydrofolate dehydrogenase/methenyltetrahydrofolate cyclohydrolase [Clostridium chauvoei]ATD55189.1 bifunctional methylenetetrahydrofolate dehydrogenase/methenyltetrahydrofolate cyclohydrolase [Clostridium chauvoei]ATD57139.1 bifunctional methylenetetrahydrofolate dehydrogenase/methenyltetrahydrofolate cyclohydrolase [Clostridium chauvoei]MBX7279533.1 bifunctional methylenetetrahydrofolate dehydrogenase/methenyltetrahydrofolate cyclohydrolase [Clostridium chauvoei]M
MGQMINGKEIALKIKGDIKKYIKNREDKGLKAPKIASILVGNDGGSIYYMNNQEKVATSLNCGFEKIILEDTIKEEDLINVIENLNNDESFQGIMLQLPLPKNLDEKKIISHISPRKDIDCLTYESQGKLYMGEKGFLPCTPNSVITLLESLNIKLQGKEVVVLGRSNIVGKPVAQLLLNKNATVTICHSKTNNLKEVCKRADILIVAIGKPKFITKEYIKDGAIIIDVGTSSFEGKITGDVNFEDVVEKASFITPVPGGVGALTTTLLIKNACEAMENNED